MRIIIQRVSEASVRVEKEMISSIKSGLLVLVGIEDTDNNNDIEWLVKKMLQLRIFDDEKGVMNLSVQDVDGEVLIVSQFTLRPEFAIPMYNEFIQKTEEMLGKKVGTGIFGAMMEVSLFNDGPVTIIIDSKQKDF